MRFRFAPLLMLLLPGFVLAADTLQVWNWNDYIPEQVLSDFEKSTGIKVEYHTFSTSEELNQALNNGTPIDVAVPSHDQLPSLAKAGRLQPLNVDQLPSRRHLDRGLGSRLRAGRQTRCAATECAACRSSVLPAHSAGCARCCHRAGCRCVA